MIPGHHAYWFKNSHPFGGIYDYDPTDDGPECEVITRILASHPRYVPGVEKRALMLYLLIFNTPKRRKAPIRQTIKQKRRKDGK